MKNKGEINTFEILKSLYPYDYSIVSPGSDLAKNAYLKHLDFTVHEYPSGSNVGGWIIPDSWHVKKAQIIKDGKLIYDAALSPLGVGALSPSFSGSMDLNALKGHLFFSEESEDAIPYHWTNLYRPNDIDWAICMPKKEYKKLTDGKYEIELITSSEPGNMLVYEFFIQGESDECFLINGHNCHPWQANDDISGCAVGVAFFQHLLKQKNKYSYKLIIAPELHGTAHWIAADPSHSSNVIGAVMLKSVGNDRSLSLQHSFDGVSKLDMAAESVCREALPSFTSGAFRTIYGNDETVFDSPGYEIPTISLTRYPFNEYHSDEDTPDRINLKALDESLEILKLIFNIIERDKNGVFAETGLICLSQQKYDLYRAAPAPGIDKVAYEKSNERWNLLMNCLPRELNGNISYIELALKYDLPVSSVITYLEKWEEKGLLTDLTKKDL
jgi:aminopeptidase-like protein